MADIQTLTTALRNAHNAGDTAAAQRIAQMIRKAQAQQTAAPEDQQERTIGQTLYENVIGSGEADTTGEKLGQYIRGLGAATARGMADVPALPANLTQLAAMGVEKALGMEEPSTVSRALASLPDTREMLASVPVIGPESRYVAPGKAGEFISTAGEFAGGAGLASGPQAMVRYGILPGLASEAAGQATEGTVLEPYARTAAALLAPTAPAFARRVISPFGGVSAERLAMAKTLEDAGVPLTAGQKTGSETLRRIEGRSVIAGAKAGAQQEAFTKAALKTIGEDASAATPEVLERAAKRIGSVFDDVVSGVDVVPDANTLTKSSGALEVYRQLTPAGSAPPIFNNINKELVRSFRSGNAIPAATVKNWRSTVSKLTRSSDAATREAAIEMMDVIDDTFNSALKAAGKPEAIAKLGEARGQWRNLLAIENAASRVGEGTAQGILSPSQLRNAVVQQGRSAFVRGKRGDIGDLTRAAEGVMKPLPTTEAGGLRDVRGISELVGAGAGASVGGPLGAVIGAAAPQVGRELAATSPIQAYLANQRIAPGSLADRRLLGLMPGLLSQ